MRGTTTVGLIELHDVTKRYELGEVPVDVLRGVDLEVEAGDFVFLHGPSGSGKTTLLNLLAGIDQSDGGTALVDGRDLAAMDEAERTRYRRDAVGYVFQFYNLLPTLTALENVHLALELQGLRDEERALEVLDQVGLADKATRFPGQLSGGEQQRVAIARALVKRPRILAADEPTGNLDTDTSMEVMTLLHRLNQEEGQTIVVATHDTSLAATGGRIVRLDHGRLVEATAAPEGSA